MTRNLLLGTLGVVVALAAWVGVQYRLLDSHVSDAETMIEQERFREARLLLRKTLWWSPQHARANLIMAKALSLDPLLSPPGDPESELRVVKEALEHLNRVSDDSPEAARAHSQAARIEFLVLRRPGAALERIERCLERDPKMVDALILKMRIYSMLGRAHRAESTLWQVLALLEPGEQAEVLRDWFMDEFFGLTANFVRDRNMGFLGPDQTPNARTLADRYTFFMREEPESVYGYVAIARWFLVEGEPETAKELLDRALANAKEAASDPLLLAVAIDTLDELGRIEQAERFLDIWPEPRDDYDWWRAKAIVEHKVRRNLPEAEAAYRKALQRWPGQIDWRTRNFLAGCLRESGKTDEAVAETERADAIERLMHEDVQTALRNAMNKLDSPEGLKLVVKFYRDLEMSREADAWQSIVDWLESSSSQPPSEG